MSANPVVNNDEEEETSYSFLMRLVTDKGTEIAQIKSERLEPLKRIIEDIKD
jgi:hypothetical protein